MNDELFNEFKEWQINKGKAKYELTDIFINDNGTIKKEKKMAWVIKTTPDDWSDFCKNTGREYEEIKLLAIY